MTKDQTHFVLIGAGIMSATLGIFLNKLFPHIKLSIYERLDTVAAESSDPWNNAGTGHSAFCELNYTPVVNNKIDISKALDIAHQFEISKQLWAYLKEKACLSFEFPFICQTPHMSFVWGDENIAFLKQRHQAMTANAIFQDMLYSTDYEQIMDWIPLIMTGRDKSIPVAVTKMDAGTDVNFGMIARGMISHLQHDDNVNLYLGHNIHDFTHLSDGRWEIDIEDRESGEHDTIQADHVFIGAGGGTLPLLEKANIDEVHGYGGFPVSGHFLKCVNNEVIQQHNAKVYGMPPVGSPPMSVPHLDTRSIEGENTLFFGPYAGFTTKFLKSGSYLDLPLSIESHNVWPVLSAGINNAELTKYLIKQVIQTPEDRFDDLLVYFPGAKFEDWELTTAGQRVQVIKKDEKEGGVLKFGTEIVSSIDKSMCGLLGASPGASTSVSIMLEVLKRMFPDEMANTKYQKMIKEIIPSYGDSLIKNGKLCLATRERTNKILEI